MAVAGRTRRFMPLRCALVLVDLLSLPG